jgi:hypothetical protein
MPKTNFSHFLANSNDAPKTSIVRAAGVNHRLPKYHFVESLPDDPISNLISR